MHSQQLSEPRSLTIRDVKDFLQKLSNDKSLLSENKIPFSYLLDMLTVVRFASPENVMVITELVEFVATKYLQDISKSPRLDYLFSELRFTLRFGIVLGLHSLHHQDQSKNFYLQVQKKYTDRNIKNAYKDELLNLQLKKICDVFDDSLFEHLSIFNEEVITSEVKNIVNKYREYIKHDKINIEGYKRGTFLVQESLHERITKASRVQGSKRDQDVSKTSSREKTAIISDATRVDEFMSRTIQYASKFENKGIVHNLLQAKYDIFKNIYEAIKPSAPENAIYIGIVYSAFITGIGTRYHTALQISDDILNEILLFLKSPEKELHLSSVKATIVFNIARLYIIHNDLKSSSRIFSILRERTTENETIIQIITARQSIVAFSQIASVRATLDPKHSNLLRVPSEDLEERYFANLFVKRNLVIHKRYLEEVAENGCDGFIEKISKQMLAAVKAILRQYFSNQSIDLTKIIYPIIVYSSNEANFLETLKRKQSAYYNLFMQICYKEENLDFDELNSDDNNVLALFEIFVQLLNDLDRLWDFRIGLNASYFVVLLQTKYKIFESILSHAREAKFSIKMFDYIYERVIRIKEAICDIDDKNDNKKFLQTSHDAFCKQHFNVAVIAYNKKHKVQWLVPDITNRITFNLHSLEILKHVTPPPSTKSSIITVRQAANFFKAIYDDINILTTTSFVDLKGALQVVRNADPDDVLIFEDWLVKIKNKYIHEIQNNTVLDYLFEEIKFTLKYGICVILHTVNNIDMKQEFYRVLQQLRKNPQYAFNCQSYMVKKFSTIIEDITSSLLTKLEGVDIAAISESIDILVEKYKKYSDNQYNDGVKYISNYIKEAIKGTVKYFTHYADLHASFVLPIVNAYQNKKEDENNEDTKVAIANLNALYRLLSTLRCENLIMASRLRNKQTLKRWLSKEISDFYVLYDGLSSYSEFLPYVSNLVFKTVATFSRMAIIYYPALEWIVPLSDMLIERLDDPTILSKINITTSYMQMNIGRFYAIRGDYEKAVAFFSKAQAIVNSTTSFADFFYKKRMSPEEISKDDALYTYEESRIVETCVANIKTKLDITLYKRIFDDLTIENSLGKLDAELGLITANLTILLRQYFKGPGFDIEKIEYPQTVLSKSELFLLKISQLEYPIRYQEYIQNIYKKDKIYFDEAALNTKEQNKDTELLKTMTLILKDFHRLWELRFVFSRQYTLNIIKATYIIIDVILSYSNNSRCIPEFFDYAYARLVDLKSNMEMLVHNEAYKDLVTMHDKFCVKFIDYMKNYNSTHAVPWEIPDIVDCLFVEDKMGLFPGIDLNVNPFVSSPRANETSNKEVDIVKSDSEVHEKPIEMNLNEQPIAAVSSEQEVLDVITQSEMPVSQPIILSSNKEESASTTITNPPPIAMRYVEDTVQRYEIYKELTSHYASHSRESFQALCILGETCQKLAGEATSKSLKRKFLREEKTCYEKSLQCHLFLTKNATLEEIKTITDIGSYWFDSRSSQNKFSSKNTINFFSQSLENNKNVGKNWLQEETKSIEDYLVPKPHIKSIVKFDGVETTIINLLYSLYPQGTNLGRKIFVSGGRLREKLVGRCRYNDTDLVMLTNYSPEYIKDKLGKNAKVSHKPGGAIHINYSMGTTSIDVNVLPENADLYKDHFTHYDSAYNYLYVDCYLFDGIINFGPGLEDIRENKASVNPSLNAKQVCRVLRINAKLDFELRQSAIYIVNKVIAGLLPLSDQKLAENLSPNDIRTELTIILNYPHPDKIIDALIKHKMMSIFIPDIDFSDVILKNMMQAILEKYNERSAAKQANEISAFLAIIYYHDFCQFLKNKKVHIDEPQQLVTMAEIYLDDKVKRIDLSGINGKTSLKDRIITCWKDYHCYFYKIPNDISPLSQMFMEGFKIKLPKINYSLNKNKLPVEQVKNKKQERRHYKHS